MLPYQVPKGSPSSPEDDGGRGRGSPPIGNQSSRNLNSVGFCWEMSIIENGLSWCCA